MSDILIKNMEMPKGKPIRIVLNPNGQLFVDHGVHFTEYEAIELSPHGRSIDADECHKYFYDHLDDLHMEIAKIAIEEMPTIIEGGSE